MDLQDYRAELDQVDMEIVKTVSKRINLVEEIEKYKEQKDIDVRDEEREEVVKQQFEKLFEKEGLPKKKGRRMAELLIEIGLEVYENR